MLSSRDTSINLPGVIQALSNGEIQQISASSRIDDTYTSAVIVKSLSLVNRGYGNPFGEFEIKIIKDAIKEDFWFLTLDDINIFCKKAVLGEFGKSYGILNIPTVMGWLREYVSERSKIIDQENYVLDQSYKGESRYDDRFFKNVFNNSSNESRNH